MNEGSSNSNIASMNEWVSLLERKRSYYVALRQTVRPIRHCSICRVPQKFLDLDRNAYEPISLSIGPYHHGNPGLQVLEEKWRCLAYILALKPEKTLQDYLQLIEGLEQKARCCYPEEFVMESEEFIKMLLLDGCFILVAFRGIQGNFLSEEAPDANKQLSEEPDNTVQTGKWPSSFLLHDILLLENQIPFFVVKEIYEFFTCESESSKIADRIGEYLEYLLAHEIPYRGTCRPNTFHHLLHFWHMYFSPTESREEPEEHHRRRPLFPSSCKRAYEKLNFRYTSDKGRLGKKIQSSQFVDGGYPLIRWRRAEQYHAAGVQFQKRVFSENDRHSLLDIRFTNGLTEVPPLFIDGNTGSFFRNIIALEQTCPQYGNYFTSYCAFWSQVVTQPADVTLLAKKGILVHHMRTDEEVLTLLTKLGKNVDFDTNGDHYLTSVCRRMEEHYQSRINRWMAWLWHNHFSNPWLSLAVLAAAIVLLCTILQSVFALLAYLNPPEA